MATTPVYGLRYPVPSDVPNGAAQIQNLATDVEAKFVSVDSAIKAHACRYYRSVTADTVFAANAPVPFDTAVKTSPLIVASGSGNTTFTVGATGWYDIRTTVRQGTTASTPYIWVVAGGVTIGGADGQASSGFWVLNVATSTYLTSGQTIQVQQNGMTISAEPGPSQSMFIAIKYDWDLA